MLSTPPSENQQRASQERMDLFANPYRLFKFDHIIS
jgi:hypothetical protein